MTQSKSEMAIPIVPWSDRMSDRAPDPQQFYRGEFTESLIWEWLHQVPDPEIPVISVVDLGVAPPRAAGGPARCPHCQSSAVEKVSQFGSTPCKAQWRCTDCLEPFDYFKCI